jgi:4-amino-4-deoxy-L-arabinose transferase-like glycosyltransferase
VEATPPTGWPVRLSRALTSRWAPVVLTLAAFGLSLVVQETIVPALSWNRDEPVYLWHVDVLRAGQLATTDGGHPDLFQPWLSAARDGELFSQYTLGWPLVLLLGALLGSTDLAVAAGAALAVAGTWVFVQELVRDRVTASVAAGFMLVSPIVLVQAGGLLNYLFTLGLGLFFLTAVRSGVRLGSRARLVGSGVLLGWIFLTRPYDAAVWGLLAAVPLLVEHRARLRSLVVPALWAAAGLLPFVVATLALNQRLTGSPTEFPITVADPLDQFGFGDRRLMPGFGIIDYGPRLALESAGRNLFWLPFFVLGAHLGGLTAAAGAWIHRRHRAVPMLLGLAVAFPVAYFAFFGTHISSLTARLSGPIYYIPAYVPLCALAAMAVVHLGRRRPLAGLLLAGALVAVTTPIAASRLSVNHDLSEANRPWAESLEAIDGRALVVPSPDGYLLFINPFGDNGADLDGRILFASDAGPELLDLVQEQPDRTPYLQRADLSVVDLLPSEDPRTPNVSLTPMEVLTGPVHLVGTVTPVGQAATSVWWAELDGEVIVAPEPVTPGGRVDVDVAGLDLPDGLHTLELRLGAGDDRGEAATTPVVRRTFYVRSTDGAVELLAPGTAARRVRRGDAAEATWEDALSVPELLVDPVVGGS